MRYEQKTTIQSLAREQQLKQQHAALSPTYVHASPPPKDDELSFMGDNPGTIATDISLTYQLLAEAVGTYILVLIGCGAACVQVYGNSSNNDDSSLSSSWMMWTIGAMLGIYSAAGISGGHLNPAITMAFCWVRPTAFYPSKVVPYILAQIVGAALAAGTLLVLFHAAIQDREEQYLGDIPSKCLTATDSGVSVFLYGVKSHIKACQPYDKLQRDGLSAFAGFWSHTSTVTNAMHATVIEAFGTAFVVFVIFSVTSALYPVPSAAVPPVVAVALGSMMYVLRPLTGEHLNPASEIGRRLAGMMWLVHRHPGMTYRELKPLLELIWSDVVPYILGPMIGGPFGAFLAEAIQPVY